jgi:hypothetical protein
MLRNSPKQGSEDGLMELTIGKDTLQDISMYQAFDHFPEGIARLIPLEELGKAIRL